MYLKALEQNINPLTLNSQSAFLSLRDIFGAQRAKQVEANRVFFAESMQTENLAEYFHLFAHLVFHYVYMENALKYTEFVNAIARLKPKAQEQDILIAFRDDAIKHGGRLIEAQHKLQEERRRLMTTSSFILAGEETLLDKDIRLSREEEELKKPIQPIHALFTLVAKTVELCIEKKVLDEEEGSLKDKINADPVRWIAYLLPIFNLLQQGRADSLRQVIVLTLNLVARRVSEEIADEIQDTLFELKWVEKVSTQQRLMCLDPGSELDKLVCSILDQKVQESSQYDDDEEAVEPENATALGGALTVPTAPAPSRTIRDKNSLRIFAMINNAHQAEEKRLKTQESVLDSRAKTV